MFRFFSRRKKCVSERSVWRPIISDRPMNVGEFADKLIRWNNQPDKEPDVEKWYKHGYPKGLPYEVYRDEEELEFNEYYPLFMNAKKLEREGDINSALEIYLSILYNYRPTGTSYYESPINILVRIKRYEDALTICDRALEEIERGLFNASASHFEGIKNVVLIEMNSKS